MNNLRKIRTNKREEQSIIEFLNFLGKQDNSYVAIPEGSTKTPDYYIESINSLVEVKEIHDRDSNQQQAIWGKIVSRLQNAVGENKLIKEVKGTFLISTPNLFKTPTEKSAFGEASTKVLRAVIANEKIIEVFGVQFEINKVSEEGSTIAFSSNGGAGSIDPANVVYQNIKDKLLSANSQLAYLPNNARLPRKIALLVNKYFFPLWDWDLYKAIARSYKELLTYDNVDEIWYQLETKEHGFVHKLLYRRSFFEQFEKSKFTGLSEPDYTLFANWVSALSEQGDEEKKKLFLALEYMLKDKKPYSIFPNAPTREQMVRFGLWLVEKERYKEALWLIQKFIDDPDPSEPSKYHGKPEFNYHLQILNGKDPGIITTVLGHLAWVIQKLILNKDYLVPSLEGTQKLLSHDNFYVKLQGMIPLIEVSRRRQWLKDYDIKQKTHKFADFHKLTFSLLNLSKYKALATALVHVFYWYQDLDTDDALTVVNELKKSPESGPILIWFGLYRKNHYPDVSFDSSKLEKVLRDVISGPEKDYENLQSNILWNFWKILQDQPDEFKTIAPYIDLYLSKSYKKSSYHTIELIIEDWLERKPEIIIPWFEKSLGGTYAYIKANKDKGSTIWLSPEKIIAYIAKNHPKKLLKIVEILKKLWIEGGFVGSPKEIFETYKLVPNQTLKEKIKKEFISWYENMKSLNPKLQNVSWD